MTDNELLALVDSRIQQLDNSLGKLIDDEKPAIAIMNTTIALVKLVETRARLRQNMDD